MVEVKFKVEKGEYEYLKRLLGMAGLTFAGTMREIVGDMARFFRGVFGDDLDKLNGTQEFYLRQLVRLGLIELARAIEGGANSDKAGV